MERKHIVWKHVKDHRFSYVFGFALLSISSMMQLVIPTLLGTFTDRLEMSLLTYAEALRIALWMLLAGLGIAFFRSVSRIFLFRLSRLLDRQIRDDLFRHWETLSTHYFKNRRVGDLMSHAISDVSVIREVTQGGIFNTLEAIVIITMTIVSMGVAVDPILTLLTLLPLPLLAVLSYRFRRRIQRESVDVQEAIGSLTSRVQEFVAGIRVVMSFRQEGEQTRLFREDNGHAVAMNRRLVKSNSLFGALSSAVVGFSFLVSVVLGGIMVLHDRITLGEFVAFNSFLSLLMGPIENLGRVVNTMQRGKASEQRLLAILNTRPDVADDSDADFSIERIEGDIELRGLSFRYPEAHEPALRDISLRVPKGTSLAIVGKVGSGKSTLVHLLVRLYNPPKGTVWIDGRDIHEIPLHVLRSHIGIVPQDQFLFSTTIRDNIGFDPKPYGDDEIEQAARLAQVYDNIVEFPNKFQTALGERGISLSGGQRQRVSIARAIIKKPSILIFDDSLSAVDTETEDRILEGLGHVMDNRTTIIIGHRISSVQSADQIVVLDEGRIVERGTHDSLLALGGLYADLYHKQLLDEAVRSQEREWEAEAGEGANGASDDGERRRHGGDEAGVSPERHAGRGVATGGRAG
ncbi:ABC transporter ATP-binding protein [Paenibacillus sp. GYB003]|uniref:ABC transporter ATP-binding protein n=1 Tax=Paenibacillus sp. GYB003 TaxID=2994392 RepID=UPI002F96A879